MPRRTIARGMHPYRQPLDDDSAARMLQGALHPDDAPPGFGPVADLLTSAARSPLTPVDEQEATATVAAMVEVIRGAAQAPAPVPAPSRPRPLVTRLLAGKALAAVAVVGLTATGAAAAATDALPDPVQSFVSDAAGHVGVNIPHPNRGKSAAHRQDGAHRQAGKHGRADDAGPPSDGGEPANGLSGVVEELKTDRGPEAGPLGQDVCAVASAGQCHSGADNPAPGGEAGQGSAPPSSGPAGTPGKGQNAPVDDDIENEDTPPAGQDNAGKDLPQTPPSTGGFVTGEDNSGGRAGGPAGKGKPESDG